MRLTYNNQSLTAYTKFPGIFTGKVGEYVERPSRVRVYAVGNANTVGEVLLSLNIGGKLVLDEVLTPNAARDLPLIPDDLIYQGFALRGNRIVCDVRNTASSAKKITVVCDVEPVA